MADVEIMLEQCKIMFQCDKEVNRWKQKKIERLERRMGKIVINWKETIMIEKECEDYIERKTDYQVTCEAFAVGIDDDIKIDNNNKEISF